MGQLGADPTVPGATASPPAPPPAAPFAPVAAPLTPVAAPPPPLQAALSTRLNPQIGMRRTFPNGRIGQWDGTGWQHIG